MKHRYVALVFLAVIVLAAAPAFAGVPDFVTYSGRLTDGTAWGQSTTVDLTFRVYDAAEGGSMLHEQVFEDAAIEDGYFSVMLTGVADVFGAHDATWITVCVGEGCTAVDDLLPRQQIGSVPYAVRAENAALLGGHEEGYYATAGAVDALDDKLEDSYYTAEDLNAGQLDGAYVNTAGDTMLGPLGLPADGLSVGQVQLVAKDGNVGIGTSEPLGRLDVLNNTHGVRIAGPGQNVIDGLTGSGYGPLHLQHNSPENLFLATGGGNVSIGATSADQRLHIRATDHVGGMPDGAEYSGYIKIAEHPKYGAAYFGKAWTDGVMWGINCWHNHDGMHRDTAGQPSAFVTLQSFLEHTSLFGIMYASPDQFPEFETLFLVQKNGNVGIGTGESASTKLEVNGTIKANGCTGCSSDARIKRNVRPIHDALAQVLALTGVLFEFDNSDYPDMDLPEGSQIGLVAQDVEKVVPEVVLSPPSGGLKSIKYANLVAVLIEAVKEQQVHQDEQDAWIYELEHENEELRARLDRLEALVMASADGPSQAWRPSGGHR